MKKILLITTGGTIASTNSANGLVPGKLDNSIIEQLDFDRNDFCIDSIDLMQKDSSNFSPRDWELIISTVNENENKYDGIVITHGTDTMAYSACALEFALNSKTIPVVLTGSQIPAGEAKSDAIFNLRCAFLVALGDKNGVFVAFAGKVIRGIRAAKIYSMNYDAFDSVNEPCVGIVRGNDIDWDNKLNVSINKYAGIKDIESVGSSFDENIAVIKLFPGCNSQIIETLIDQNVKGIVLEGFGCGGIMSGVNNSFLNAIAKAVSNKIVVVIASQCRYDGTDLSVYEVGVKAKSVGVVDAKDMTNESIIVKLMWAVAHFDEYNKIVEFMNTNIVGEFIDK